MAEAIGRSGLRPIELQEACEKIGKAISAATPDGAGFLLLLFDFGGHGNVAYLSNAVRRDVIELLKEFIPKLEAN